MNHLRYKRSSRGNPRRAGTAILEMTIALVLLFNICFGLVEFGYFFYVRNTMESCAREGCRAAIVPGATESAVTSAVVTQLQAAGLISSSAVSPTPYTIVTTPSDVSSASLGDTVSCTVSALWTSVGATYSPLGIIKNFNSNRSVSGNCTMRKEG